MQIEISAGMLKSVESRLSLLTLIAYGQSGRHVVVVKDRCKYNAWIAGLGDKDLQDEIHSTLDDGEASAALGAQRQTLNISPSSTPLDDALVILGYPLRILLENGRNDRDFLFAYADGATRTALVDAAKKGWLLFETAGGINETKRRLEEIKENGLWAQYRFYCLVDSDARDANTPSSVAVEVQKLLKAIAKQTNINVDKVGKVLDRRAVENYLYLPALKAWLRIKLKQGQFNSVESTWKKCNEKAPVPGLNKNTNIYKQALFAALALECMPTNLRAEFSKFFDFSSGRGSTQAPRTADSLWTPLSDRKKSALQAGFGKNLLRKFFASQGDLPDPTATNGGGEIKLILSTILERL